MWSEQLVDVVQQLAMRRVQPLCGVLLYDRRRRSRSLSISLGRCETLRHSRRRRDLRGWPSGDRVGSRRGWMVVELRTRRVAHRPRALEFGLLDRARAIKKPQDSGCRRAVGRRADGINSHPGQHRSRNHFPHRAGICGRDQRRGGIRWSIGGFRGQQAVQANLMRASLVDPI